MSNERIIEKIKKCLALSESSNEHEAATALRRAQALMREHNINSCLVGSVTQHQSETSVAKVLPPHISELIGVIAAAFGVKAIITRKAFSKPAPEFYGDESAVRVAAYSFDICHRQLSIARRAYLKTVHKNCKPSTRTKRADLFSMGWVRSVAMNLPVIEIEEETRNQIEEYIYHTSGELGKAKQRGVGKTNAADLSSYSRGREQGADFQINHGVDGEEQLKISA